MKWLYLSFTILCLWFAFNVLFMIPGLKTERILARRRLQYAIDLMKWLYLSFTILCLWFAFNVLFMIPGKYEASNFWAAGISILIAVVFAWRGGRKFISPPGTRRAIASWITPPVIVCITGLIIITLAGILRVVGHRWP